MPPTSVLCAPGTAVFTTGKPSSRAAAAPSASGARRRARAEAAGRRAAAYLSGASHASSSIKRQRTCEDGSRSRAVDALELGDSPRGRRS